jgi:hypothetical protein
MSEALARCLYLVHACACRQCLGKACGDGACWGVGVASLLVKGFDASKNGCGQSRIEATKKTHPRPVNQLSCHYSVLPISELETVLQIYKSTLCSEDLSSR